MYCLIMNKDCEGSKIMHIKNIVSSLQCLTLDDAFLKYYHQLIAFNAECQLSKKVKQTCWIKKETCRYQSLFQNLLIM